MRNGPTKTFDVAHQFHFSRFDVAEGLSAVEMQRRLTKRAGLFNKLVPICDPPSNI